MRPAPPPRACTGPRPVSRRGMLQIGGVASLGLSLPDLLRAESAPRRGPGPTADACIVIHLNGGPSHLDTVDMKPNAPAEVRGEFQPIASSLPGVFVCEHLPWLAPWMHHFTVIRSAHHGVNNAHAAAVYTSLTGHDRGDATVAIGAGPDDWPSIGAVLAAHRPPERAVPANVVLPYITAEGRGGPPQPGFFGGWLGRDHDPLFVLRDPNADDFGMPELTLPPGIAADRFARRHELASTLGAIPPGLGRDRRLRELDQFQSQAFDLLTSPAAQRAFRIDREGPRARDRYGRNIYGQSVLLARRLIEAGARFVGISWAPDANATWDTHAQNFAKLKNELLPQLDMALSSLIQDLVQRGMLERALVVVMGEFGRGPKINAAAGRDHWNRCYSLLLAGGGIRAGYVHGASDRIGAVPVADAIAPAEIVATIYRCLGLDPALELRDRLQRPLALVPWGKPVPQLLA